MLFQHTFPISGAPPVAVINDTSLKQEEAVKKTRRQQDNFYLNGIEAC